MSALGMQERVCMGGSEGGCSKHFVWEGVVSL